MLALIIYLLYLSKFISTQKYHKLVYILRISNLSKVVYQILVETHASPCKEIYVESRHNNIIMLIKFTQYCYVYCLQSYFRYIAARSTHRDLQPWDAISDCRFDVCSSYRRGPTSIFTGVLRTPNNIDLRGKRVSYYSYCNYLIHEIFKLLFMYYTEIIVCLCTAVLG